MIISKSRKGSVDNFRESGIEVFVFCFRKRKTMTVGDKSFWKMSKGVKRKEKEKQEGRADVLPIDSLHDFVDDIFAVGHQIDSV